MALGIAMIASVYPPAAGGIQSHTQALARALVRHGARVLVITRRHRELPGEELSEGVTVYRVGLGDASRAVATASYVAGALQLLMARRRELDVLHVQQMLSPMTIGLAAGPLLGVPLVINPHACGPLGDVQQLLHARRLTGGLRLRAARRLGDAFVCINRLIAAELGEVGVEQERLWRLPNGVDITRFRPAPPDERARLRRELGLPAEPLAVSAGRLSPEKGVDVLLETWAHLKARVPRARLLILGDGEVRGALERRARELGIAASAHFGGAVSDVAPYLRAADAFVLPSRTEGLPVALLEAMACGLPCVATAVGGTPEVLDTAGAGWLVPGEAPWALAEALGEALAEGGAARGARARALVEERYALDRVAARYLALYQRVVAAGARSRRPWSARSKAPDEEV